MEPVLFFIILFLVGLVAPSIAEAVGCLVRIVCWSGALIVLFYFLATSTS